MLRSNTATPPNAKQGTGEPPVFLVDLNLDQIIDAITASREEYNLKPSFYTPLSSIGAIQFRHEIMQDLEDPELLHNIESFAGIMRAMREHLAQADKLHYKYQQERWLLDAVAIYGNAVHCLLHDLSLVQLRSRCLLAFREYVADYVNSERFESLAATTKQLTTDLSSVTYCLQIKGGRITVRKYESETDYSAEVEETFEKFKQGAVKDYRAEFYNPPEMNHIEARIIRYRQDILRDCLKNPTIVKGLYDVAIEASENKKRHHWGMYSRYPNTILYSTREVMQMFMEMLKKLKNIAETHAQEFESEGFTRFFAMLDKELGEEYFARVRKHLKQLKFRNGVLISAQLGAGNKGIHYILRTSHQNDQGWLDRIFAKKSPSYSFALAARDGSGARALSDLTGKGINLVANALAQSAEHILGFFDMLRTELAFYVGCLSLHEQSELKGRSIGFPHPEVSSSRRHSAKDLYDLCLALHLPETIVGNDVTADGTDLVLITGANQGGKSTFLRSIGLAQLMMQCGLFVPAQSFQANICNCLFTHYKREEDTTMESGKLDEELLRMSAIVDDVKADSLLLFNESFAATNEREGSEIARQITSTLVEKGIKVFFVTQLYEFARTVYDKKRQNALFLRAERQPGGKRTFKIIRGAPLQTSYGEDLYNSIFGKGRQSH